MKKRSATLFFLLFLLVYLSGLIAATRMEASQAQPDLYRTYLRRGIEKAFNLEAADAMTLFQKAVELDRENPTGHAFLALAHLFFYEMSFDANQRMKEQQAMLVDVTETLAWADKRVGANPRDGQAYFAMTLARIVKIRWAIHQKRYLVVAQEASTIWDCAEKARALDPLNYDAYFPIGLLHYHLGHLPTVTRFLSSLLITPADRQKGLQELALAAQKGDLLKELAQAELSSVYTYFEDQPAQAAAITAALKERFPQNYNFSFALANTFSELSRFEEAFGIARNIEQGLQAGTPPFVPQLRPRYDHLLGRILFKQGDYPGATECFQKALRDTSVYNARIRTSSLVRLGMIHDVRGERKQAEECYVRAMAIEGGEGIAQVEAKRYLATPYAPTKKQEPRQPVQQFFP